MAETDEDETPALKAMRAHSEDMMGVVPWASELGMKITRVERARAWASLPWDEKLIGDPDTGVLHGGVITSLLDNLCGVAIAAGLKEFRSMATLDLRIDYMRPAEKGRDVIGEAECYQYTRNVAFTRAWAYHETRDRVIATAAGAFALNDPARWASGGASGLAQKVAKAATEDGA
ncbi:MAG: PaaI family thioesterase [Pseudomonadota bacterium]